MQMVVITERNIEGVSEVQLSISDAAYVVTLCIDLHIFVLALFQVLVKMIMNFHYGFFISWIVYKSNKAKQTEKSLPRPFSATSENEYNLQSLKMWKSF